MNPLVKHTCKVFVETHRDGRIVNRGESTSTLSGESGGRLGSVRGSVRPSTLGSVRDPFRGSRQAPVSPWLREELRRFVEDVAFQEKAIGRQRVDRVVEYWDIYIAHPFGMWMEDLRYAHVFSCSNVVPTATTGRSYRSLHPLSLRGIIKHTCACSPRSRRYTVGFVDTISGMWSVVEVPGTVGMRIWSRYKILENMEAPAESEGKMQTVRFSLVEDDHAECMWGLGTFIRGEHQRAHKVFHKAFVEMLEERQDGAEGEKGELLRKESS